MIPAKLGQVTPGGDPQLGRQGLDQHGHQVAGYHHPDQRIAKLGACLDVGGEIAWVHVGDGGDEGRAEKRQKAGEPPSAAPALQDLDGQRQRTFVGTPERVLWAQILSSIPSRPAAGRRASRPKARTVPP